ncbi:Adenylyl cyclase-associated protein [Galdieria sulphuraria]|uniref:Adenylyl cyclase-associated protein n=1 Tax=Galdieria sulphuraria TaxID=130081 RepID=M2XAT1_GALSU|nr:adenylyl cyclase-associated protein [Galdieria sulphuraria]EME26997.1 adenylyl cyclase-associated protein [Galdieria sulphuraria]GJD10992.1 Adenylyl cyclase-associated protein [Galdieria sulphuraria]|eukprot:XP_005703517.1 adenylyl cyclase-associated protein [Galdieria sulphuraria]
MAFTIGRLEEVTKRIESALERAKLSSMEDNEESMNASKKAASPQKSLNVGAPPPPGPPPPPLTKASAGQESSESSTHSALFAAINAAGTDITKNLKRVSKPEKQQDEASQESKDSTQAKVTSKPKAVSKTSQPSGEPKCYLKDGKTWNIEYQNSNYNIQVEVADKKHSVYIYRCIDSVVKVIGKCNSITIDSCNKCGVVFESALSTCTVVNCNSVQLQVEKQAPSVAIDKTDGANIFIPSNIVSETQVVTAKSSSINVTVTNEEEDPVEFPLPEQFINRYVGGRWTTEPVRHE